MGSLLLLQELLVDDFLELDHGGGGYVGAGWAVFDARLGMEKGRRLKIKRLTLTVMRWDGWMQGLGVRRYVDDFDFCELGPRLLQGRGGGILFRA